MTNVEFLLWEHAVLSELQERVHQHFDRDDLGLWTRFNAGHSVAIAVNALESDIQNGLIPVRPREHKFLPWQLDPDDPINKSSEEDEPGYREDSP